MLFIILQEDGTSSGCHISQFIDTGETWQEYLERMDQDKEWGSHIELAALVDALGVAIIVTNDSCDKEDFQTWIYPKLLKSNEMILLGYANSHYYSLQGMLLYVVNVMYGNLYIYVYKYTSCI